MESVESLLLSSRENKVVIQILGKGRKSLATGVAQIFLALPSDRTQWTKLGTGVVCLVKDKQVKSFFIRFFDIKEKVLVWEQELYKQFKYRAVSKYFQTFFAHDCRAGINFSSADEAATFRTAVMERVNIFKKKREVARQKKLLAYQQQQQLNYQMQALQNSFFMPNMQSMMMMRMRAPLVAANQMQAMFNSMPPETRQVFLDNLKFGGSMPAMSPGYSSAMLMRAPHQVKQAYPYNSTSYQSQQQHQPKHPFSNVGGSYQTHSNLQAHPQEYVVGVPPINTETVASTSTGMAVPQPPSSPQPPPIQGNIPPPPPPPCAPSLPTHSNSLEKGNLPGIKATESSDRGGLLQSIQAGTKLKKVTESRAPIPKVESNSMRGLLARALDNRAKVLGDEDSDDDDEWDDDDDDDWSD